MRQAKVILLVDDEAIVLLALKREFHNAFGPCYRCETALDGAEALHIVAALAEEGAELLLVFSDWLMPGMKGDELLTRIHRDRPDTKLVLLTGHADEDAIAAVEQEAELLACVRKPWNFQTIKALVRRADPEAPG